MLDYNRQGQEQLTIVNRARFVLGKPGRPSFPEEGVDLVFLCEVYHQLKRHVEYLVKTKSALTPNGRVAIIDYGDERSGTLGFSNEHLVPREQVIKDMEQAGYTLSNRTNLPPPPILPRVYSKQTLRVLKCADS